MTPRLIAPLVAAPLCAAAVAGALEVEHALAAQIGATTKGRVASTLVLFVVLALLTRAAAKRAGHSERPLRGVALAGVVLGAWLLLLEWTLPAVAGVVHGIGDPRARYLAVMAFQLPWVLALVGAIPYLIRGSVSSTPQAPAGTGWVVAALALGAGLAFLFSGTASVTWGLAALGRGAGLMVLGITLFLLWVDKPLPHGAGPPPGTQLGVTEDGQNPNPAMFALGLLLGAAFVGWTLIVQPLAGGPLAARALVGVLLLGGIGAGALIGAWLARHVARPDLRMLLGLAATGYLVLASLPLISGAPAAVLQAGVDGASRLGALQSAAAWAFAPAAIAAGFTLLLGVRVRCDWTGTASESAGLLLAWTLAGLVIGVAGAFVLLERGSAGLVLLAGAGLAIGMAAALRLRAHRAPRALFALLTIVPLLALLWPGLTKSWLAGEPSATATHAALQRPPAGLTLDGGTDLALYAEWFTGRERVEGPRGNELPDWSGLDGRYVWLAKPDGRLRLDQAGRSLGTLATGPDPAARRVEVALGLIPALLHPRPSRALVLGPGTGLAPRALLGARVGHVELVTSATSPLDLVREYMAEEGLPIFGDPRVEVHLDGARAHLPHGDDTLGSETAFDVIVAGPPLDPSVFTSEGVRGMRRALRPGGIVALHLPFEGLDAAVLRRVLATVREQFADVWVFRFREDLVVVAAEKLELGRSRWKTVLLPPAPAATLARRAGLSSPGRVLGHLTLDTPGVDRILPVDGAILSDDRPWLAHRLEANRLGGPDPRRELGGVLDVGFPPNLEALVPDARERDAWMAQIVEGWLEVDAFVAGVWDREIPYGTSPAGWRARARAAMARGEPEQAVRFLDLAIRNSKEGKAALVVERVEALAEGVMTGRLTGPEARADVLRYGTAYPTDGRVLAAVGAARLRFGDLAGAQNALEAALRQDKPTAPAGTAVRLARVVLAGAEPDTGRAKQLMESDPGLYADPDALDLYLGLLDPADHGKRAGDIELAIKTLHREEAERLMTDVRATIARGAFEAAAEDAARVTELQTDRASAWELRGVVELGRAAAQDDTMAKQALQRAAVAALLRAVEVSMTPERSRDRAEQLAQWFGVTLPPAPSEDAAGD